MEIRYKQSVIRQSVGDVETEVMLPDFGDEQEQQAEHLSCRH